MGAGQGGERARHWRHPGLPDVDLLRARYVTHTFTRHTHNAYTIGLVEAGVEEWRHRGSIERAGVGGMPIVNPDTVHTGHAGVPEGWTYRVFYPSVQVVTAVAAELGMAPGTPYLARPVVDDQTTATLFLRAHRAAEAGDALAACSLTRVLLAHLLRRYGSTTANIGAPPRAGATAANQARDILHAELARPPSLDALAAAVRATPFALLRAFREQYGLPPHAYLTQLRVYRARDLLDIGRAPADVAAEVGFVDQAHLSRHFRRILGVPPGRYQRERRNVQDPSGGLYLPSAG
ncbi:MAG TPA: AraC family transcriptional regulator [Pseudonocardiaceae bacterium]|nr:AraC family transcriptional regulator [Pseudonocardiaceae bacterium]